MSVVANVSLPTAPDYGLVTDEEGLSTVLNTVLAVALLGQPFGFDIETSYHGEQREEAALHPEENYICGISLTSSTNWARYIPIAHDDGHNVDPALLAKPLWDLLATGQGVAHGAKFELRCLSRFFRQHLGLTSGYFPVRSCTLLESYAEGRNRSHGLKEITKTTFGHEMTLLLDLFPSGLTQRQQKSIRFSELDQHDPKVYSYACEDSVWALAHHLHRYPRLIQSPQRLVYQTEMAVLPVICEMEDEGVLYDWNLFREGAIRAREFRDRLSAEVSGELTRLVRQDNPDAAPVRINLASSQQVARVLYEDLKMPARRKSRKTGRPSTDKLALKGLQAKFPVVKKIAQWKQLTRLLTVYLEAYERDYSYATDGRAHPSMLQHGVPAGRFAVAKPPYQQSPKRYCYQLASSEVFEFNFRDGIKAPDGWYILGFDYSQIELRVIAGEAREQVLIDAFSRGDDVHSLTASLMLGKPLAEVSKDDRALGKTLNFALVYQMGVDGLADRLAISHDAADELFSQYFAAYPRIKPWTEKMVAGAKSRGYVVTKFGRRVPIWEFESAEQYMWKQGERVAGNVPVQGPASDYMKIAMVRADRALAEAGLKDRVRAFMNIHDALEFYVRKDVPPADVVRVLHPAVAFAVEGWPPMVAEWHAGLRWGSVVDLDWDGTEVRRKTAGAPEELIPLEDPDEDGPALPAVDVRSLPVRQPVVEPEPVAAEAESPAGDDGAGPVPQSRVLHSLEDTRRVLIQVQQMPTATEFARLREVMLARPGKSPVVLVTPGGEVDLGTSSLGPACQDILDVVFAGKVMVTYDLDGDDLARLASGLL